MSSILRTATKVFLSTRRSCPVPICYKTARTFFDFGIALFQFQPTSKNVSSGLSSREGPTSLAVSLAKLRKQRSTSNLPYDSSDLWGYLVSIRLHQCFKTHRRLLRRIVSASGVQSQVVLLSGQVFGLVRHSRRSRFLLLSSHRDVA